MPERAFVVVGALLASRCSWGIPVTFKPLVLSVFIRMLLIVAAAVLLLKSLEVTVCMHRRRNRGAVERAASQAVLHRREPKGEDTQANWRKGEAERMDAQLEYLQGLRRQKAITNAIPLVAVPSLALSKHFIILIGFIV